MVWSTFSERWPPRIRRRHLSILELRWKCGGAGVSQTRSIGWSLHLVFVLDTGRRLDRRYWGSTVFCLFLDNVGVSLFRETMLLQFWVFCCFRKSRLYFLNVELFLLESSGVTALRYSVELGGLFNCGSFSCTTFHQANDQQKYRSTRSSTFGAREDSETCEKSPQESTQRLENQVKLRVGVILISCEIEEYPSTRHGDTNGSANLD